MDEERQGFRNNHSVDDVLQITRRLVEEICFSRTGTPVVLTLYDIEKAYPRVTREALWQLLEKRGTPVSFIRICKALHNHTVFSIRTSGVVSEKYAADRGLKEGCPSSPPLFNINHQAVPCDFRARRKRKAEEQGWSPGVPWKVIVDDRLRRSNEERQTSRHQHQTLLQDVEFADDTATIAMEQEFPQADRLLDQTFSDWNEKLNRDKTETLVLKPNTRPERRARSDNDAPNKVRHVGGLLTDTGTQWADTTSKCLKAKQRAKDIAKAWATGTAHGRGRSSRVKIATRLKVMRSVVVPTLVALGRSRAWTNGQIAALQAVQTYALQRCFGLDKLLVRDHHITTEQLHKAAQWPTVKDVLCAATLRWIGHVARMPTSRLPKQALWGFWMDGKIRNNHATTQVQWISTVLKAADIHKMHWFKLAQNHDPTKWDALIVKAFPRKWLTKTAKARLNRWRPKYDVFLPRGNQ